MRARSAVVRRARRLERTILSRWYASGPGVECSCCGWTGRRFLPGYRPRVPNRICPGCGASERYRALFCWLPQLESRSSGALRVLEVAPFPPVGARLRAHGHRFTSLDLSSPRAEVRADLCRIPFRSDAFDVAVCFHVLEHIPDDRQAVEELARVVGRDGVAVVVIPVDHRRAETFEDRRATPDQYEVLYGQSDHVRIYGADAPERLRRGGMTLEEHLWSELFTPEQRERHALDGDDDRFLLCRPPSAGQDIRDSSSASR